ncbi:MAG: methyltransferase domain-containing protein [Streptosporangiaceae bacterium]
MSVVEDGARSARRIGGVRTSVVWDLLHPLLAAGPLDVVDAGGGTGGFAVPLAGLGHRVTVVDPSPDALAALERRAAEAGVTVRGVQADADDLLGVVGPETADLVLCHSVLEYVDDPAAAMAALAGTVRPGGRLSVLVSGRLAAVLHRAISGQFEDARSALGDPLGRWGDRDPVPRRFTRESLAELASGAHLTELQVHGVRIFADLVSSALVDADPEAARALIELEAAASTHPVLRDLATQLHLLATRRAVAAPGDPAPRGS